MMVDGTATNRPPVFQNVSSFPRNFYRSAMEYYNTGVHCKPTYDALKGSGPMLEPMDIFKMREDGSYLCKGAAHDFDLAKPKVNQLGATSPGLYIGHGPVT